MAISSFEEWKVEYLENLANKEKPKSAEKIILQMSNNPSLPKVQQVSLQKLLQAEYKKYCITCNLKSDLEAENAKQKELIRRIHEVQTREAKKTRRQRAHELITIGSLTELIGFPKDRGIVAGALDYVLEKIREDKNFENIIKTRGNRIIKDREDEKTARRTKKNQPESAPDTL